MIPTRADLARHLGEGLADTTSHLPDGVIEMALADAPVLAHCARALTNQYGRYVLREDLAQRIAASEVLQVAERRARAAVDQGLLANYQGPGRR
jgi:hypothetical protein